MGHVSVVPFLNGRLLANTPKGAVLINSKINAAGLTGFYGDAKMDANAVESLRQATLDTRAAMPIERVEAMLRHHSGTSNVTISELKLPSSTGFSSGALFIKASFDSREPEDLFLKYHGQAAISPFHIYNLANQFAVQKVMFDAGLPVPEPLYLDAEGAFLGCPGYVMRRTGGEPGSAKAWCDGALATASPDDRDQMLKDAISHLVAIHALDKNDPNLAFLYEIASGEDSLEREVNWALDLAKFHGLDDHRVTSAAEALLSRRPAEHVDVVNHGDNKFDNFMFVGNKVAAIIDFEMTNVAPREMDLAYLLFVTRTVSPPDQPNPDWFPDEARLIAMYEEAGGEKIRDFEYYQDLAAFKFSVMMVAFVPRLGLLESAPRMLDAYWGELERISSQGVATSQ